MEKTLQQGGAGSNPQHGADCNSVFIVEDSPSIRARLIDMLSAIDGISIVGETGLAIGAVSAILRTHPDSVVLDLQLPDGSGIDVLRQVHALAPGIVFIILTNYPNPQYRRICLQAGASHFLDKTADFGRLATLLSGHQLPGESVAHPTRH